MTDNVLQCAARILALSITNELWLAIGYGKRPKHGALFQHFRPKWRVDLEKCLLREMVGGLTAAYILADVLEEKDIDNVISVYVDGTSGVTGLFRTFGFLSRKDALTHFNEAIREYHEAGRPSSDRLCNWSEILMRRIGITRIPDRRLSIKLLAGSINFAQRLEGLILVLRSQRESDGDPVV